MHCHWFALLRLFCLTLWLVPGSPAWAGNTDLTLCYEDVAQRPWSMPGASGLNFDLLRQVEKQLGERFIYRAKPWRRCIEEVRLGASDGVIGAVDSLERRAAAAFPTLPDGRADPSRALYEDHINVYLRTGGKASWDGAMLQSPNNEVAVQAGYVVASQLRQQGLQPRELVKSAEDGLRLLSTGLFDAAVLQGLEAVALVRDDPRFQGKVVLATPPYAQRTFHLVFNHARYQQQRQRIDAIWRAIASVRQSPDYQQRLAEAMASH